MQPQHNDEALTLAEVLYIVWACLIHAVPGELVLVAECMLWNTCRIRHYQPVVCSTSRLAP